MEFPVADTLTSSLNRLTSDEQKAAETTAFDLRLNPASPGMQLHRIDLIKDKNFWSARITRDLLYLRSETDSNIVVQQRFWQEYTQGVASHSSVALEHPRC